MNKVNTQSNIASIRSTVARAQSAEARDDYNDAALHWRSAYNQSSDNAFFALRLVASLEKCGRSEDAELTALNASNRFSDNVAVAIEFGWLAARRRDWTLALLRWQNADVKFPENPVIVHVIGTAFLHLGRLRDSEAVFAKGHCKFGNDGVLAFAYATFPAKEARWADAVERLTKYVEQFPEQPNGFAQLGSMLRMAGRKDEAQRVLETSAMKFPVAASIAIELAKLVEPDWALSIERWKEVAETFPDDPAVHAGLGSALRRSRDHANAEEVLRSAQERFDRHYQIACEYAILASDKSDWNEAMQRWENVLRRFPGDEAAKAALARVRWSSSLNSALETASRSEGALISRPLDAKPPHNEGEVMARFESLGENCEFGLVQRQFLLEPLGLLRFSYVHQSGILRLLKTRFQGVGDPEFTQLDTNDNEFLTSDLRYGMNSHTYVAPHSVDPDIFFKEQCKRLGFLRRKLISDLEDAAKVFVITAHGDASDDLALDLHSAMGDYGNNRLLYVRASVEGSEPGSVRQVQNGLFFGFLDRWGGGNLTGRWNISYHNWLKLCQTTIAMLSL